MEGYTCKTCAKKDRHGKCRVLAENIGAYQECWAWSDDRKWQERAKKAVEEYKLAKGGRSGEDECVYGG